MASQAIVAALGAVGKPLLAELLRKQLRKQIQNNVCRNLRAASWTNFINNHHDRTDVQDLPNYLVIGSILLRR